MAERHPDSPADVHDVNHHVNQVGNPDHVLRLLGAAAEETRQLGRPDLTERLEAERRQVESGVCHVLVVGEFKKGKSAFVNALLGVPVCSCDAIASTSVPTVISYGETARADLVLEDGDNCADPAAAPTRRSIDAAAAAGYARAGVDDQGARLRAVEVWLPRELLRGGLVIVDTPGVGGGFAAAQAAATMRAMSLAAAVVVVSDASQEYTAPEVEFLRRAAGMCSNVLCLLAKTDFYPEWRRIPEINRGHLQRAGVDAEIVPVSSVLRELAVDTGDHALNSESGFPIVVDRLQSRLLARQAAASGGRAAATVRSVLGQVAGTIAAEHEALARPEQRSAALRRTEAAQRHTERLTQSSARWMSVLGDRFADIQSDIEADLRARMRRLRHEASERINSADPSREWAEIVPWIYYRTNEELTDHHTLLLARVDEAAEEIAALFAAEAAEAGATARGAAIPSAGEAFELDELSVRRAGLLETSMHAARGWSLSSSVITTLLVATLHPALWITLPITAALGGVFAVKTVRSFRTAHVAAARTEALRALVGYLDQARQDASKASSDTLRRSRGGIRDHYLDRASELQSTARQERAATVRASDADRGTQQRRLTETSADLARVRALTDAADQLARQRPVAGAAP
jgi:hypothetical protein